MPDGKVIELCRLSLLCDKPVPSHKQSVEPDSAKEREAEIEFC
jgi:hypothetical protein